MSDQFKNFKVDKNAPVPMYFQIKQELIKSIKSGKYQSGDKLPTELEFCEALHVSRPTIRQALQELINEGYVTRHKAKGTFISKPKVDGTLFKSVNSFNDEMQHLGLQPSTNVLHQEIIPASAEVSKNLKLKEGDSVFHIIRLRYADQEPITYCHTYIPYQKFKHIENEDFTTQDASLYQIFDAKYGTKPAYVERVIEANNGSAELCALLDIKEGQVIFHIETIAFDEREEPMEFTISKFRGDRCRFSIRLSQSN